MEKIRMLGIGRDPVVLQKLLRFINENPAWEGQGVVDDQSALTLFNQQSYPVVFIINDVPATSWDLLCRSFSDKAPETVIFRHYGDSTGLLISELTKHFPVAFTILPAETEK